MSRDPADTFTPRILVVDDEKQIHASLRLRLGKDYEICSAYTAADALALVKRERFDLCFADIHMPVTDGLTFIGEAQRIDPALGFVVLSAFDSGENLRRSIPLGILEFIGKPLPERLSFESKIPEWVSRTRRQRRDLRLVKHADAIENELASAKLAQETEIVASESARGALQQTSTLLTTIHAHLVTAQAMLGPRSKSDTALSQILRNLEGARKTADTAISVAEGFFDSAYGSRDSSPAHLSGGIAQAIEVAQRLNPTAAEAKIVDFAGLDERIVLKDLSGIDFLLLMAPAIGAALNAGAPKTTIGVHVKPLGRLDAALRESALKESMWINRRNAHGSQSGFMISITASAEAFSRDEAETWLKGGGGEAAQAAAGQGGVVVGLEKCHGLLAIAIAPTADDFRLTFALPA